MMLLRIWRLITLVLVTLLTGLEFAHVLELPVKMQYDGAFYVTLQNSLYQYFGAPGPGAFVTRGAVLGAIALTVLVRKRHPAFKWTLAGMLCLLTAFPAIYFLRIEPVNAMLEQASATAVPTTFQQLRSQWEYGHATNFACTLAAFFAFAMAILSDSSQRQKPQRPEFK